MWKSYVEPLKSQGLRLGTPAPSSAPSGKTWIQDWLSVCAGGCNPDFVALRMWLFRVRYFFKKTSVAKTNVRKDWYDINATQFQLYLEDFHDTFNLPIWVTEWACQVREHTNFCASNVG